MPYLNLDLDYFDHPKTMRLVRLLGVGAELFPVRLWCYCGKFHYEDGRFEGYSPEEIESRAGWKGKEGLMLQTMKQVGYMERSAGHWQMCNWNEHQGHIAKYRERGRQAAIARWSKARDDLDATSNATSIAGSNAPALPTKPTDPNQPAKRLNGERLTTIEDRSNGELTVTRSSINRDKETELMGRLTTALGIDEMETTGGHWRVNHVRKHPALLERAIAEVERMTKEGETFTVNAAACLEDLVKRWK